MTDHNQDNVVLVAMHELHTNHSRICETLDSVDPATGEFQIRVKSVILKAGEIHEVPAALASELFEMAAKSEAQGAPACVRLPTDRELQCFHEARGTVATQR